MTSDSPPRSSLALAAEGFLRSTSPPVLVEHCARTYLFGAALLEQQARPYDAEGLYVASCLHDLGLLAANDDGETPFELRGAELARTLVLDQGGSDQLAELVHDAVALHLELATAEHPIAEVAGVSLGAAVDVLGLRLDQLPAPLVEAALAQHPREDLKAWLAAAMLDEATRKPTSTVARYVEELDFLALIRGAPFDS